MASEKRLLTQINLRLTRAELLEVDEARGEAARNAWIRGAIYKRLGKEIPATTTGGDDES